MKRLAKPLAAASLVTLSASCATAPPPKPLTSVCPVCAGPDPTTPTLPPSDVLPARLPELSAFVVTHATITPDTTLANAEVHVRAGAGLEVALPMVRSGSFRWIFSQALMGGAWGDQQHGVLISESATGLKTTFAPALLQFLDVYAVLTEGLLGGALNLPAGRPMQWGSRLGGGVGGRVFRAFAIELTGHWVYAFGEPFALRSGRISGHSIPDLALSFGVDACAFGTFCDRAPTKQQTQQTDDATCVIYTRAKEVCEAARSDTSHPTARQELCQHAADALSIKADAMPVLARDVFRSFLGDLEKNERGTPRAGLAKALLDRNACLESWRSCGRRQECILAQRGERAATRRVYSPYAIEMLAALGCTADGNVASACAYTCEDPPPATPVCP